MKRLYPEGKAKAFVLTYDDGIQQDVRFVKMLNRYGLKGTFNLNSGLMKSGFAWTHPCGMEIRRLTEAVAAGLYDGHEVASHTLTHPYMYDLTETEIMHQMTEDKKNLEALFGRPVCGFAVPFDYYSDLIAKCAENSGFEYARCSEFSDGYAPGTDYYHWAPGVFHVQPNLMEHVEGFLNTREELALCQIAGHSYDLDTENLWDTMERVCAAAAAREDVWSCTNLELVRYLKAMRGCTVMGNSVCNNSGMDLWFEVNGEIKVVRPGGCIG